MTYKRLNPWFDHPQGEPDPFYNTHLCSFGVTEVIAGAAIATAVSDVADIATNSAPTTPLGLFEPAIGGAVGAGIGGAFAGAGDAASGGLDFASGDVPLTAAQETGLANGVTQAVSGADFITGAGAGLSAGLGAANAIGASPSIISGSGGVPAASASAAAPASIVSGSGGVPAAAGAAPSAAGASLPATGAGGVVSAAEAPQAAAQQIGAISAGTPAATGAGATDLGSVAGGGSAANAIGASPGIDFPTGAAAPLSSDAQTTLDNGITQAVDGANSPGIFDKTGLLGSQGPVNTALNSPVGKIASGLAPTALTAIRGAPSLPSSITPLQNNGGVTAPLIATETSQLNAANSGQATPSQAAQIATFKQQAQQQLFQSLANAGVQSPTQDSRYIQGMESIDQQATALLQGFINSEFQNGFAAAGSAASNLSTAAQAQINQDANFQSALNAAFQSFGLTMGASNAIQRAAA